MRWDSRAALDAQRSVLEIQPAYTAIGPEIIELWPQEMHEWLGPENTQ